MPFTLATWNINSVRLRLPIVEHFLKTYQPEILCLQETKCPDDLFPLQAFHDLGYPHIAISGQKGYHGVATISKLPLELVERRRFCDIDDTRHISTRFDSDGKSIILHNFYIPAGGDEPDVAVNPKFKHKLDFLEEMRAIYAEQSDRTASILVGDLNIAPLEHDVWSHKQLLKVVSHTPVETETFEDMRKKSGWVDLMRERVPADQKLYTWWSYRARDWSAADRGRRLDHIWSSANLAPGFGDLQILREARGWDRPSDHVPVLGRFDPSIG
ncbi:exodeoxyribonuclease III [Limoniibacter endophyticus]|uniref:Exodeoxyribonuclease III n=1 Tax=Limoniibacter endophyticus TaxID=1565040 RepID=A0A8J3DJK2_9HYPH|nr:exodeoxyribonuclease III [Limoniibacter endophyticus]GHC73988.1 exodeoxyribonuclease III [Limoniibacter endophyticus]